MNIKLNYVEKGNGEVLILLHGNSESLDYFIKQIEYFSKFFRVIAIDTRGHGKSERGEREFTIHQFAEDLYGFMQEHKIDKANILGFSDGGNIAMCFVLKYPEKVNKLILNGANLNGRGVKPGVQIPIIIGYKIASFFAGKSADAKKNAEMLGLMVNDPDINPAELAKIDNPTLIITGTRDMIKDSHTKVIAENIKGSKWVRINGDHFVANKNPAEFNCVVSDFLKSTACRNQKCH